MTQTWQIASYSGGKEVLKETGSMGRFLFDIEERPGLGIDADRIRATMVAAPDLLEALLLCVVRDSSLKANAMVMQAIAKAGSCA